MVDDLTRKTADVARHYAKERKYWIEKLSGQPPRTIFPYDEEMQEEGSEERLTAREEFAITGELYTRLMQVSTGSDPTLHIILTAALTLLLSKYGGQRDIVLGTPVYKQEEDAEYVNTALALRTTITPGDTFKQLLLKVKDAVLEADENQNYPLETLAGDLELNATAGGDFPLFDVTLLLENIHDKDYLRHIRHNLMFIFARTEESLQVELAYNPSRYHAATIKQVARHLENHLNKILFELDIPIVALDVLSDEERKHYLEDYNATQEAFPADKQLHQLFEEQVAADPEKIALVGSGSGKSETADPNEPVDEQLTLTYGELNRKANRLAHTLRERGVGAETIVGIMAERSVDMVVAILGVLKSGGAYLPIAPGFPAARKQYMIEDSAIGHLLSQSHMEEKTKELVTGKLQGQILYLDKAETYSENETNPGSTGTPSSPGYIIYTSGTTGKPKGVLLEHRGIVNYITWAGRKYVRGEELAFPLYTGISFDLTVTSIFTPLLTGNTIYIYAGDERDYLLDKIIVENKVGVIKLTPAHLKLLTEIEGGDNVKRFILGGENLETQSAAAIHQKRHGKIEIYNEYGPTETVVGSMIYQFDPEKDTAGSVPIGDPIANTQIYLLDPDGNPVPAGVPGEIYIGGTGVGRGYLNRPELTAEKFVPPPSFHNNQYPITNNQLYRTGDLARRHENGTVEFLGRIDDQVKIRGHRVELGEIGDRLRRFKKQQHTTSILEEKIVTPEDTKEIKRCTRCLLSVNHQGVSFDSDGVCHECLAYDGYAEHAKAYYKPREELDKLLETTKKPGAQYDCLLLFSGGKDSTYVLHKLIDMGMKVITFTFDNGYISESAFENIKRTTSELNVEHITKTAEHMNRVFVESLESNHNVCHGCWHALNTVGAQLAHERGIELVVSGLSRGQIFDMRLHGLFQTGVFEEKELEEKLLFFRKGFHSTENKFSRLLGSSLQEEVIEKIQFVDFFRYDDTKVPEIKEYLLSKGWVQPTDTGFCSSNCKINDIGIYMYIKERGCHFYEAPLSWDVRLGQMAREAGIEEVGFEPEPEEVHRVLSEIGYYEGEKIRDAVVLDKSDDKGNRILVGYLVSDNRLTAQELRKHMLDELPDYMVPSYFVQVDRIPLSASGKVDRKTLLAMEAKGVRLSTGAGYVAPSEEQEVFLANLFKEMFNLERVGVNDNFFEIGASSFELIQLNNQIVERFGEVPVLKLFEYPTIASFLDYLRGDGKIQKKEKREEEKWDKAMKKGKSRLQQRRKKRK